MAQLGPKFAASCIGPSVNKASAKILVLSASQSQSLLFALEDDAKGAIYSALVSMADAFSGLQRGYYSWATVKLYYACFYLAKAALARRGFCVFYVGSSPYYLRALPGESPLLQKGNSHTVVTELYKLHVVSGMLNAQPIDGIHAFDWIKNRREDVNYRDSRFSDPIVPAWFAEADKNGVRRILGGYMADPLLYAFDDAHALIALPLATLLEESSSTVQFSGLGLSSGDVSNLKAFLFDKSGPIYQHFTFL